MNPTYVDAPIKKIYFPISTVSRFLRESSSCIRFWMRKFKLDTKRGKGNVHGQNRYFTREDIGHLKAIRRLIRDEGYTLRGAIRKFNLERKNGQDVDYFEDETDLIKCQPNQLIDG